jgi:hypothetical protein
VTHPAGCVAGACFGWGGGSAHGVHGMLPPPPPPPTPFPGPALQARPASPFQASIAARRVSDSSLVDQASSPSRAAAAAAAQELPASPSQPAAGNGAAEKAAGGYESVTLLVFKGGGRQGEGVGAWQL